MTKINLMFRSTINEYIQPLKDKGCKIWSISRLNNFNTCKRQYYFTYIDKKDQKQGIYSFLGSALHSDYEDLYEGKTNRLTPNHFNEDWLKAELFQIQFPSDKIKNNYKKDIDKCYEIATLRPTGKFVSELGFVLEIDENNYILGYIDLLEIVDENRVKIVDFKSSAMFKDKKLISAGHQLVVYQLALEQLYGLEVIDNGWLMCKYSDIYIEGYKPKIAVQNKDMVSKCENTLKSLFKKQRYNDFMAEMFISQAIKENSFDNLPDNIKSKITIKTHYKSYNITDEIKEETMEYIKNTIKAIEEETEWECKPDKFFCQNLCGFNPKYCNGE